MTPVHVACPACGRAWLTAYLHPWGDKTPEKVAARVVCDCGHKPVRVVPQTRPA